MCGWSENRSVSTCCGSWGHSVLRLSESSGFKSDTSGKIVKRESMKQLITTPLNSTTQGQTWQSRESIKGTWKSWKKPCVSHSHFSLSCKMMISWVWQVNVDLNPCFKFVRIVLLKVVEVFANNIFQEFESKDWFRVRVPARGWKNCLLLGQLSVLLFRNPFHTRVIAEARKRSWSLCQKCRWPVTAKLMHPMLYGVHSASWISTEVVRVLFGCDTAGVTSVKLLRSRCSKFCVHHTTVHQFVVSLYSKPRT